MAVKTEQGRTGASAVRISILRQVYLIRETSPRVRRQWERLTPDQKRLVLAELDGDLSSPAWTAQVISDVGGSGGRGTLHRQ